MDRICIPEKAIKCRI